MEHGGCRRKASWRDDRRLTELSNPIEERAMFLCNEGRNVMYRPMIFALTAALFGTLSSTTQAFVNPEELARKNEWASQHLVGAAAGVPFSFVYDRQPSASLLPSWQRQDKEEKLDANRVRRTTVWTDPKTALEVRCISVEYLDFPTVEWTVYFKNTGKQNTPILENIQAIDTRFQRGDGGEFTLHHGVGGHYAPNGYQPLQTALKPGAQKRIAAAGGCPTNTDLCYFNLEWPGEGVILAFGWPGQWAANFVCDAKNSVQVVGGQELTHFYLAPGEDVRSPLVAMQFWKGGDWLRAQNVWRRWMVEHNLPRPGGKLASTHYGSCWSTTLHPSAAEELAIVEGFHRENVKLDYYFIDAGWYPCKGWTQTGTWETDPERFPKGMQEVSDRVHSLGMKFVLWFEPERVGPNTWLHDQHPEWLLSRPQESKSGVVKQKELLNLGNPEAWKWVTEHFNQCVKDWNLDVYREDFNIDPLPFWRANDAEDRQGITENKHVQGHLAYWDEILRRNPGVYIDSCASGGRRNDLETLRRAVPLLRSDWFTPAEVQQAMTMGISLWIPYHGSGMGPSDVYWYRSCIFPASRIGIDTRKTDQDYALLKKMIAEFHEVEKYLLGDFYPLTSYSLETDVWAAWQYDRPEMGEGIVQVFRRDASPYEAAHFPLRGLDPNAKYRLKDFDKTEPTEAAGKDLMETGLPISLPQRRSSCLIQYQRVK
jgi:alpha-galactosidase